MVTFSPRSLHRALCSRLAGLSAARATLGSYSPPVRVSAETTYGPDAKRPLRQDKGVAI